MREAWASFRVRTALLLLESTAAHAGCAMACAFGSSAEFEAAVIRRKLEAGAYGPKRRRRYILAMAVATAGLVTAALSMIAY
jgi:hypothetical protein